MRYFHYISSTKVDMLSAQLPDSGKTVTKSEIGFNLGIINGRIAEERAPNHNLIKRLETVEKAIRSTETVGGIDDTRRWISGSGPAICARITDTDGAIFYFLRTAETYLALGGSRAHLISAAPSRSEKFGLSYTGDLISCLERLDRLPQLFSLEGTDLANYASGGVGAYTPWAMMIYHQCHGRRATTFDTRISFLARRICDHTYNGKRVILATPLYVEDEE